MQNVDNEFKQISQQDFNITGQTLNTEVASISTRQMQVIPAIANDMITKVNNVPDEFKVDAKAFIERPFFVDKVVFNTSSARYSFLTSKIKFVPGDIARSNASLLNVFKMAAYGRPELVVNVSIAGTITHAGCVLVGILPPMPKFPTAPSKLLLNTILTGPHAFLYANEATSVNLSVPWYCNTDLATTDMETTPGYIPTMDITTTNGNYATLVLYVLNPLSPSTGSSNSLTIVIEACFKNFDLMIPTPRYTTWNAQAGILGNVTKSISGLLDNATGKVKEVTGDAIDGARQWITSMTGLHNPNLPIVQYRHVTTDVNFANIVDSHQYFEKLDPFTTHNRILKEPIFGTSVDEQSLKHITSKKQFLGTFTVTNTDDVGKLKWVRPISPFQGGFEQTGTPSFKINCANNLETLHSLHRGWSGKLRLHLISVMNNKQQVKLKVIKMYNPSVQSLTNYPAYESIANAPSHLLEFTAGGQEQIVDLPFLCRNGISPCAENTDLEALFHGLYYVYVAQNLVISDSSPTSVEFNVFMSAPDITFYGYQTKRVDLLNWSLYPQSFEAQSGTIKVMNEPQTQQGQSRNDDDNLTSISFNRLNPIVDIRPTIRRMYRLSTQELEISESTTSSIVIPLNRYLGENPKTWIQSPLMTISRMYYGKSVGFKFRLQFHYYRRDPGQFASLDDLFIRIFYVPQNINQLSSTRVFAAAEVNSAALEEVLVSDQAIPLTFKIVPDQHSSTTKVLEFVVPDTSFYKFMGGPQKFEQFSSSYNDPLLTQADFGSIYILLNNYSTATVFSRLDTFVGLTDESRMGFHTMAAPISIEKASKSFYLGNNSSSSGPPPSTLNTFTYLGGFV